VPEADVFQITWSNRGDGEPEVEIARLLAIVRLAAACEVVSLDAGTIERILQNDASICGASNPSAFARLCGLLQRHHEARKHAVERIDEAAASLIVDVIIECLRMQTSRALRGSDAHQSFAA
jgi:hypothetical protein